MANTIENYGFNRLSKPPTTASEKTERFWEKHNSPYIGDGGGSDTIRQGPYTRMYLTTYAVLEEEKKKDAKGLTTIIVTKDQSELVDRENGVALYIRPCHGHSTLYYKEQFWAILGVLTRKKGKVLKLLKEGGKFKDGPLSGKWAGLPEESRELLTGFIQFKFSGE